MKKIFLLFLLFSPSLLFAQTEYGSYNWDTFPPVNSPDTVKAVNGASLLMERRIFEMYLNAEEYFEELFVYHRKLKIESHDALSGFNKIYISLKDVIEIVDIEARFISPTGKITNLPKESIKQIDNMDNKGDYKTFAVEGAEIGGQIEYYYILRRKFDPSTGYYLQEQFPKSNVETIFVYPSKMEYVIKSYNGLPAFETEKDDQDKIHRRSFAPYIPAAEEEPYSNYKADLMRFEYCFTHNHYNSNLRKYSWNTSCENVYNNTFALSKDDISAAESLCKQILGKQTDTESKVRTIENWIKTNITIDKDIPAQTDLAEILKLKQANVSSAIRLFVGVLQAADVRFELVSTGDNTDRPFDPEFNCNNFLNEFLLYFPELDNYLTPDNQQYRMGIIPPNIQGQYGLFMRPFSYNKDIRKLAYQVRYIPVQDYKLNSDTLFIDLKLDEDEATVQASIKRVMTGELGLLFQSGIENLPDEKKKEVAEDVYRMSDQKSQVSKQELINADANSVAVRPFIWKLELTAGNLIENAGNDLIFHLGETIGQQSELYQEKSRKLPISIGMLHNYFRRIVFEIPEGYQVANPENMDIDIELKNGDKIGCMFLSKATIKGNKLIVESTEYYTDENYPAERYDEFRQVINAAADFNKRTVLLKKI